jgi:hypothetical protein
VLPNSDAIVRSIGAGEHMHADFGSGLYQGAPIGIPYVSGASSRGWDNDDLHSLHGVPGSAFEVVDSSRLPRP